MHTITIKWLSGKQVGQIQGYVVDSNAVGWYYEVGSTHTVPGVGRFQVVSL